MYSYDLNVDSYKGRHPDYAQNLERCQYFMQKVEKYNLTGMKVKIVGSSTLVDNLLAISWQSPMDAKIGNYCYNVNLHQPHDSFCQEMKGVYNLYYKFVKDFWEARKPVQMSLPLTPTASKASGLAQDRLS
jgi:hypothetical protein